MQREERSIGALLMVLVTLGLLGLAFASPWFHYDFSTARKVAPDGPYEPEVTGIERHWLDFSVQGWSGDIEPSDPDKAGDAVAWMHSGILAITVLLVVAALGEVPVVASYLRRRIVLTLLGIGLVTAAAVAVLTWSWLPESLSGLGVDSQYTARLSDEGYTHTTMGTGWYAMVLSWCTLLGAALFKFQAGDSDPDMVEAHRADA